MRIVAWNCNVALDRKVDLLLDLAPDIAVVCGCAEPERLRHIDYVFLPTGRIGKVRHLASAPSKPGAAPG